MSTGFSGLVTVTDQNHPSYAFMLADLERSGLTPDDIDVVPLNDVPPRYRIRYIESGEQMYRDRIAREPDDDRPKYIGPDGVFDLWSRNAKIFERWSSDRVKLVIEGEKKAACALKYFRAPAVGIGGCWGYMRNHEPLARLFDPIRRGDHVVLVLDGDVTTNEHVGAAARRFANLVIERGASIRIVNLGFSPQGVRYGFDDWVMARRAAGQLSTRGLRDEFDALPAIEPETLPELRMDQAQRLGLVMDTTQAGNTVVRACETNAVIE